MPYSRSAYNSHPQSPGSYSGSNSGSRSHRPQRGARSHDGRSSLRQPSPFPESRRSEGNRVPHGREASRTPRSTYGTYILPLEAQGQYRTMDPTKCGCNCCPHPTSVSGGHEHRYQETPNSRSSMRPSSNGHQRSSSSRYRSSDNYSNPNHNHDSHDSHSSRSSTNSLPNFSRKRRNSQGRYLVDVVDKSTGSLNREYGRFYPISLNQHSSSASVEAFLVPDGRRAKVIVHWGNGQTERLGSGIPMQELLRHADYLEVKDKKQVHWE
ncbi:hypothetical protein LCI18_009559 [Fusarium solani-melongenae]|uniref:Uncharacterized protein n=1 Tax=Fusarium solani subsp. cucurbitae TaxID=2747967 RepID=A0ACD3ZBJ4_FUSSC|nr:hypothetical protein LCI18_009559 [Fusarium solani-melongenae]